MRWPISQSILKLLSLQAEAMLIFANVMQESDADLMSSGLSFRAVSEFIKSDNLNGLKVFLESRHVNIEDKDEVRIYLVSCFFFFSFIFKNVFFTNKHNGNAC
jgi:hypothetical protein